MDSIIQIIQCWCIDGWAMKQHKDSAGSADLGLGALGRVCVYTSSTGAFHRWEEVEESANRSAICVELTTASCSWQQLAVTFSNKSISRMLLGLNDLRWVYDLKLHTHFFKESILLHLTVLGEDKSSLKQKELLMITFSTRVIFLKLCRRLRDSNTFLYSG